MTDIGWQQAKLLAQFLKENSSATVPLERDFQNAAGFSFTHLYSSLMIRSVATGTLISKAVNLPLVAWEDIHECRGIYLWDETKEERISSEGKNRAYFEANYPDFVLPTSLGEKGWWNRPIEEPEQWLVRGKRFFQELLERHGNTSDRVAIVSHGGFFHCLLSEILNLPSGKSYFFVLNNAAISRIDFEDGKIRFSYLNRVDFLPKDLIT